MEKADRNITFKRVIGREGERLEKLIQECFSGDENSGDPAGRMKYVMSSGGKRLRPILCVSTYRSVGGKEDFIYPFALIWEILHNFSLVHDDLPIMDDDAYRRGKPTLHVLYGTKAAILTGVDLLCYSIELLMEMIREYDLPHSLAFSLMSIIADSSGFGGMVGGQMMDLYWEGKECDPATVETIHHMKTAKMIEGSIRMGAVLGGANGGEVDIFGEFGIHLGLAYQLADDLLDQRSDFSRMGKTTGRDAIRKKATFLALFDEKESEKRLKEEIEKAREALDRTGISNLVLGQILAYTLDRGLGHQTTRRSSVSQ
jgi:geranylgeranyl diphosphate synthase type II